MALGNNKTVGSYKDSGFTYEGKPILLAKKSGPKLKQPRHRQTWYPEDTKIQAATLWAVTRNWDEVSRLTDVSVGLLKKWQKEAWWQNVLDRVIKENNDRLDASITEIIDCCAVKIKDRLDHGDTRINYKTGEQFIVPVDIRALTGTLAALFDKRQLLRGEATSRTESISADRRLAELKQEFEKFSKATEIEGEAIHENELQQEESEDAGQGRQETLLIEAPASEINEPN